MRVPSSVSEPAVIGHRAFKREIPFLSGAMVLPTTSPAKWGLERVWFRLQKVPDFPRILCRCFRRFETEPCEHGELCGCLNSPKVLVLCVPGAQGCGTALLPTRTDSCRAKDAAPGGKAGAVARAGDGKATVPCPRRCPGSSAETGSPLLEGLPCALPRVSATRWDGAGRHGGGV